MRRWNWYRIPRVINKNGMAAASWRDLYGWMGRINGGTIGGQCPTAGFGTGGCRGMGKALPPPASGFRVITFRMKIEKLAVEILSLTSYILWKQMCMKIGEEWLTLWSVTAAEWNENMTSWPWRMILEPFEKYLKKWTRWNSVHMERYGVWCFWIDWDVGAGKRS